MEECMFIMAVKSDDYLRYFRSKAYQIIRELNAELKSQGYMVLNGKSKQKLLFEEIHDTERSAIISTGRADGGLFNTLFALLQISILEGDDWMPAYKDKATDTWFVKFYSKDWKGENRQVKRRGFKNKKRGS